MDIPIFWKHHMSCLRDQPIDITVDRTGREVTLSMAVFDSALVAAVVTRCLPEYGVRAYHDDNDQNQTWLTRRPPFRLLVELAATKYRAQVVRLFDSTTVAVTLEPIDAASAGDRHG